jgi:hypothetical protein
MIVSGVVNQPKTQSITMALSKMLTLKEYLYIKKYETP